MLLAPVACLAFLLPFSCRLRIIYSCSFVHSVTNIKFDFERRLVLFRLIIDLEQDLVVSDNLKFLIKGIDKLSDIKFKLNNFNSTFDLSRYLFFKSSFKVEFVAYNSCKYDQIQLKDINSAIYNLSKLSFESNALSKL